MHVEAGIQVERLMLHARFPASRRRSHGRVSGQTIAGVISTSVHGSDWDRGRSPTRCARSSSVGPGGTRHWIEPDQWRITDQAALRARLGPDVQIRYDDDWSSGLWCCWARWGSSLGLRARGHRPALPQEDVRGDRWSALKPLVVSGAAVRRARPLRDDRDRPGGDRATAPATSRSVGAANGAALPRQRRSLTRSPRIARSTCSNVLQYLATAPLAAPVLEGCCRW